MVSYSDEFLNDGAKVLLFFDLCKFMGWEKVGKCFEQIKKSAEALLLLKIH